MKRVYLKPETEVIGIANNAGILAGFSNNINNSNPNDDHGDDKIEEGGEGEGGDDMGARRTYAWLWSEEEEEW